MEFGLTDEGALGPDPGDGAEIGAGENGPGGPGDGNVDDPPEPGGSGGGGGGGGGDGGPVDLCADAGGVMNPNGVCNILDPLPGDPGTPDVRFSDLVAFHPVVPAQAMEPGGWAVAGLPANFVSPVAEQTQSGVLLGYPVTIRFTPTEWVWDYGDGSWQGTQSGGQSWEALGVSEFSDTLTSHIFRSRGAFTVVLTVEFAAEYQFAGRPWRTIAGTLPVEADPITVIAVKAKTVLVDEDCLRNPTGPGC